MTRREPARSGRLALVAALALVCGSCSGDGEEPAGPGPAAPEASVRETFEPADCALPGAGVEADTVAEVVYGTRSEPLDGLVLESAVATPGGDRVELTVVREADGCTGTATVTGPAEQEYDVLGLRLDVGSPAPSEGDESRAQTPVRILADG